MTAAAVDPALVAALRDAPYCDAFGYVHDDAPDLHDLAVDRDEAHRWAREQARRTREAS